MRAVGKFKKCICCYIKNHSGTLDSMSIVFHGNSDNIHDECIFLLYNCRRHNCIIPMKLRFIFNFLHSSVNVYQSSLKLP